MNEDLKDGLKGIAAMIGFFLGLAFIWGVLSV